MTDHETALRELLAKGTDASLLREMIGFPREHRAKIHSTNPLERVNCEIKRKRSVEAVLLRGGCRLL
jgi:transposase-like protein